MVHEYQRRRDMIVEGLRGIPGVTCRTPAGAFYVFPNIKAFGRKSSEVTDHLLDDAGVAVLPGSAFGEYGEGYLRLSYATSREHDRRRARAHAEITGKTAHRKAEPNAAERHPAFHRRAGRRRGSMPRKVKIILNPMADMHNAWRVANDLRPLINDYGGADWSGTVYPDACHAAGQAGRRAGLRHGDRHGRRRHRARSGERPDAGAGGQAADPGRGAGGLGERFRARHRRPDANRTGPWRTP